MQLADAAQVIEAQMFELEQLLQRSAPAGRVYFDQNGMHIRVGTTDTRRQEIRFIAGGIDAGQTARFAGYSTASNAAGPYVISNGYFDGSNWNLDDTAVDGAIYSQGDPIAHQWRYIPNGSNPRTPVVLLELYNDGGGFIWNRAGGDHDFRVDGDSVEAVLKVDAGLDQTLANTTIAIKERADQQADITGYGQLWVKNTTPCQLWFTDDTGTDTQLA